MQRSTLTGDEAKKFGAETTFRKRMRDIADLIPANDPTRGLFEGLARNERRAAGLGKPRKTQFFGAAEFAKSIQKQITPEAMELKKIKESNDGILKTMQSIQKKLDSGLTIEEIIGSAGPAVAG